MGNLVDGSAKLPSWSIPRKLHKSWSLRQAVAQGPPCPSVGRKFSVVAYRQGRAAGGAPLGRGQGPQVLSVAGPGRTTTQWAPHPHARQLRWSHVGLISTQWPCREHRGMHFPGLSFLVFGLWYLCPQRGLSFVWKKTQRMEGGGVEKKERGHGCP